MIVYLDGKPYREQMAAIIWKMTLPPVDAYRDEFNRDHQEGA